MMICDYELLKRLRAQTQWSFEFSRCALTSDLTNTNRFCFHIRPQENDHVAQSGYHSELIIKTLLMLQKQELRNLCHIIANNSEQKSMKHPYLLQ